MDHHYLLHVCRIPREQWPGHYFPGLIDFLTSL